MINIFGGKITTYRRLAESVMEKVEEALGARKPAWTSNAPLPGGDFPVDGFESLVATLKVGAPGIAEETIRRLARNYGTLARRILGPDNALGRLVGADLGEREVDYLMDDEWARSADDILWRRSKLGLKFAADQVATLQAYIHVRTAFHGDAGRTAATQDGKHL